MCLLLTFWSKKMREKNQYLKCWPSKYQCERRFRLILRNGSGNVYNCAQRSQNKYRTVNGRVVTITRFLEAIISRPILNWKLQITIVLRSVVYNSRWIIRIVSVRSGPYEWSNNALFDTRSKTIRFASYECLLFSRSKRDIKHRPQPSDVSDYSEWTERISDGESGGIA